MPFFEKIRQFQAAYPVEPGLESRMTKPQFPYFGDQVLEAAQAALLAGKNLLLMGEKATGKNVLAENLAYLFGRPLWNISFHVNIDAYSLLGSDSLRAGDVYFRPGPIAQCAQFGGFGVLDEINMARNEAVAVLHSILDHRRIIDLAGYQAIPLHPACRFIATMNDGYAGTRELNQALLSRFVVIDMPVIQKENLIKLLTYRFPSLKEEAKEPLADFFLDLHKKAQAGEISEDALDLRGLLDALSLVQEGLSLGRSLAMGISNKLRDALERQLVEDLIHSRLEESFRAEDLFSPLS